jgi:membrane carboxypeptidase/penicillin-binding protein PbpC
LGYPNWLDTGRPTAAKIGQTIDKHDVWTIGYSPYRLTAVWVGLPNSQNENKLDYHAAAGIWNALMQYSHQNLPADDWGAPTGISTVEVCDPSGQLPTRFCPATVKEVFLSGNEPTSYDNLYRPFSINRETGRLATVFTPLDMVEERVYMSPPPEAESWAQSAGITLAPTTYDNIQVPASLADINVTNPALFAFVHGLISVQGSANGSDFSAYRLQVGQGLNPTTWQTLDQPNANPAPITNAVLGKWNTTDFDDGLYALRLTVIKKDNTIKTVITQVTVDNTAPAIRLLAPQTGQNYSQSAAKQINFSADVSDAVGVDKVEWYVDNSLVGTSTQSPYAYPWTGTPGKHTLQVKAFDLAGNENNGPTVQFSVEP